MENVENIEKEFTDHISNLMDSIRKGIIGKDSIRGILNHYLQKFDEVQNCAQTFIPVADEIETNNIHLRKQQIDELIKCQTEKLKNTDDEEIEENILEILHEICFEIEKLRTQIKVNQKSILIKSLFLNLFSIFDAFIGDLLKFIFLNKKDQLNRIEKTLSLKDIIDCKSIEEAFECIIDKEIETLKRESYIKQFSLLEQKFDIKTLRKFDNWTSFVEISQRRNIIMHADGIVSNQYLSSCKEENYDLKNVNLKDKLEIDIDYLNSSILIFKEIVFKLGQTLWRKLFPDMTNEADSFLIEILYDMLIQEEWKFAVIIAEYGITLHNLFNDSNKKLISINYAIALKNLGYEHECVKLLDSIDFSSSAIDLKMACEVLKDDFNKAFEYLNMIGSQGEYLDEKGYRTWPLFKHLRKDARFGEIYSKIYGKNLTNEIQNSIRELEIEMI